MKRFFPTKLHHDIKRDPLERYTNQINSYNHDLLIRKKLINKYINIKTNYHLFLTKPELKFLTSQLADLDSLINEAETEYNKVEKAKKPTETTTVEIKHNVKNSIKTLGKMDENNANDILQLAKDIDSNYIQLYQFYQQLLADCYYLSAMSNFYMAVRWPEEETSNLLKESNAYHSEAIKFELPEMKQKGLPMSYYKRIIAGESVSTDKIGKTSIELLQLALINTFDTHLLMPMASPTASPRTPPITPRPSDSPAASPRN